MLKPLPSSPTRAQTRLATIFVLTVSAFAPTSHAIEARQEDRTLRWQEFAPHSDRIFSNGHAVKTITVDGLAVSVSVNEEVLGSADISYRKFVVYLFVANSSDRRIDIMPEAVTLRSTQPQTKPLARETAEHLAGTIRKWAAITGALEQFSANLQTTQSTTTSRASGNAYGTFGSVNYFGTATATTTSPDLEARVRATERAGALNGAAARAGADLQSVELKRNTVLPKQEYGGMLIFAHEKKSLQTVVTVKLDNRTLEFPFLWVR